MKPSDSKARRAARKRQSRKGIAERTELDRQHAAAFEALPTIDKLQTLDLVARAADKVAAGKKQRAKELLENAAKAAEEPLTTTRTDSDGKIVHEPMRDRYGEKIRQDKAEPPPPPPPARPLTHAERVAPASTAKPMNKWTMAELEAHKAAHRAMYAPRGDARGSQAWFIAACNSRNNF